MRPSKRRLMRHGWIAMIAAGIGVGVSLLLDSEDPLFLTSMGLAYASLALLAATLLLGPINVLLDRPNPTSTYIRRDLGVWGASLALLHMVVGLQVHLRGSVHLYFIFPPGEGAVPIRYDAFGLANWIGLAAAMIAGLLLGSSSDRALRWLGRRRWKRLQRTNYLLFVFVVIHGIGYQIIENRPYSWMGILVIAAVCVSAIQVAGFRAVQRRRPSGSPDATS